MKGAPARRVVDCLHTVGPAEIYACGAEPIPKAPTNVSDGHGRVPLSGSQCSAQESPCLQAWGVVNNLLASIFPSPSLAAASSSLSLSHVTGHGPKLGVDTGFVPVLSRHLRLPIRQRSTFLCASMLQ